MITNVGTAQEIDKRDLYYICSPLSDKKKYNQIINMNKAKIYADLVAKEYDCRTIAPHSFLPKYLIDDIPEERNIALKFGLEILTVCKKLVVCGERIREGMQLEINFAKAHNIDIIYFKKAINNVKED